MIRSFASHVAVFASSASLQAFVGVTNLPAVAIDGTMLVTPFASVASLIAVSPAVLVTPQVCGTVLLAVTTIALLVTQLFSLNDHLLASVAQLNF